MPTFIEEVLHRHGSDAQSAFLLRSITDFAIYMLDLDGTVLSWNPGAEWIKGFRAEEIIGRNFSILYTEEDRAAGLPRSNLDTARRDGRLEAQGWRLKASGGRLWASVVIHAVYEAEMLVGFAKVTRDCSEQKRQTDAVDAMTNNMSLALSFLPDGACLLDGQGTVALSNPALLELFPEAVVGTRLVDAICTRAAVHPHARFSLGDLPWLAVETDVTSCEIAVGDMILSVRAKPAQDRGWVVTFANITARRQAEDQALHQARHDILTGIANRACLDAHLKRRLADCIETGGCAVLYLDLDRFKAVNDTWGHDAGDAVLKEAARRIVSTLRTDDFACRLGGDEFIVVPAWRATADGTMRTARRLQAQFNRPFVVDARQVEIGASIGVSVSLPGDLGVRDLIGNADLALYKAKREGRGCIRVFDNELGLALLERRTMEMHLSRALSAGEFRLVYQPICAAGDRTVLGFEALLRWTRADGVDVPPSDFIPIAEELGVMAEIGGWVLEEACREAARWPSTLMVAVNVSATQLHDPKLIDRVGAALQRTRLDPGRLELELTETAMIKDRATTLRVLTRLRNIGVGIAIDDFGTGYSSLSFLQTLPFTRLKIDRSFVVDLVENPISMAIVRAVMSMGQDLGLAVTAEGVETEAQHRFLTAQASPDMQGYLFAKAMPPGEVLAFLEPERPHGGQPPTRAHSPNQVATCSATSPSQSARKPL